MSAGGRGQPAGRGFLELLLDTNEARRALRRFERNFRNSLQGLRNVGAGLGVAGGVLTGFFGQALREASRIEQVQGRFSSVMGHLADDANEFAESFAASVNQSATSIQDSLATFQSFLQGSGLNAEQAFPLAKQLATASENLLAFDDTLGTTQESVQALLSILRGETGSRLGAFADVREDAVNQELLALGINKTQKEATQEERILARLSIVQRALGRSGITGQAAREVNTLASQFRGLSAAGRETLDVIGQQFAPIFQALAANIIGSKDAIQSVVRENRLLVAGLALVGPLALAAGAGITVFAVALSTIVTAGVTTLSLILSPGGVIITGLVAVGVAAAAAGLAFSGFGLRVASTIAGIKTEFDTLNRSATGVFDNLIRALRGGDVAAASELATASIEKVFADAALRIIEVWRPLQGSLTSVFRSILAEARVAGIQLADGWTQAIESIRITTKLLALDIGEVFENVGVEAAKFLLRGLEAFYGFIPGLVAGLESQVQELENSQQQSRATRQRERQRLGESAFNLVLSRGRSQDEIDTIRRDLKDSIDAIRNAEGDAVGDAQRRAAEAADRLAAAMERAAGVQLPDEPQKPDVPNLGPAADQLRSTIQREVDAFGDVAGLVGGGEGIARQQLQAQRDMIAEQKITRREIVNELGRLGPIAFK